MRAHAAAPLRPKCELTLAPPPNRTGNFSPVILQLRAPLDLVSEVDDCNINAYAMAGALPIDNGLDGALSGDRSATCTRLEGSEPSPDPAEKYIACMRCNGLAVRTFKPRRGCTSDDGARAPAQQAVRGGCSRMWDLAPYYPPSAPPRASRAAAQRA